MKKTQQEAAPGRAYFGATCPGQGWRKALRTGEEQVKMVTHGFERILDKVRGRALSHLTWPLGKPYFYLSPLPPHTGQSTGRVGG